jgi:hypothetical protein
MLKMSTIDIYEAKMQLSKLFEQAVAGITILPLPARHARGASCGDSPSQPLLLGVFLHYSAKASP